MNNLCKTFFKTFLNSVDSLEEEQLILLLDQFHDIIDYIGYREEGEPDGGET